MSLNKITIIGNVGKDPEVKQFDNGSIVNLTVATNERGYTTKNGAVVPDRTEWHNVVVKGAQADFCQKFVKKGSGVLIEGKLRTRDYEKNGEKRYITEIHASSIEFFSFGKQTEPKTQTNEQGTPFTTQSSDLPF